VLSPRRTTTPPPLSHYTTLFRSPGLYQVRAVARDSQSGRTGSAMQWVEIPDFTQREFRLSSIFLGERAPDEGAVAAGTEDAVQRSEEHTSELQSPYDLVCRLLLE